MKSQYSGGSSGSGKTFEILDYFTRSTRSIEYISKKQFRSTRVSWNLSNSFFFVVLFRRKKRTQKTCTVDTVRSYHDIGKYDFKTVDGDSMGFNDNLMEFNRVILR